MLSTFKIPENSKEILEASRKYQINLNTTAPITLKIFNPFYPYPKLLSPFALENIRPLLLPTVLRTRDNTICNNIFPKSRQIHIQYTSLEKSVNIKNGLTLDPTFHPNTCFILPIPPFSSRSIEYYKRT